MAGFRFAIKEVLQKEAEKANFNALCMIIDLRGVTIGGKFEPIELGCASLTLPEHGKISFEEFGDRLSKMKQLIRTIIGLRNRYRRPTQFSISYHSSHIVPCIVRKLNKLLVDNMDLVDAFDCPSYCDMDTSMLTRLGGRCLKHRKENSYTHCSLCEVEIFMEWLLRKYVGGGIYEGLTYINFFKSDTALMFDFKPDMTVDYYEDDDKSDDSDED